MRVYTLKTKLSDGRVLLDVYDNAVDALWMAEQTRQSLERISLDGSLFLTSHETDWVVQ